jgi:hypothetical protein
MTIPGPFSLVTNGGSLPWSGLPEFSAPDLVRVTAAELDHGARLCAWFGVPEAAGTRLVPVLRPGR